MSPFEISKGQGLVVSEKRNFERVDVKTLIVEPGSHWETLYFNKKLRGKLLNLGNFDSILESQILIGLRIGIDSRYQTETVRGVVRDMKDSKVVPTMGGKFGAKQKPMNQLLENVRS